MGQANHITTVISHSSLPNRSFIPSLPSVSVFASAPPSSTPSMTPGTDFSPLRSSSSSSELSFFPFFFAALSISAEYSLCLEMRVSVKMWKNQYWLSVLVSGQQPSRRFWNKKPKKHLSRATIQYIEKPSESNWGCRMQISKPSSTPSDSQLNQPGPPKVCRCWPERRW